MVIPRNHVSITVSEGVGLSALVPDSCNPVESLHVSLSLLMVGWVESLPSLCGRIASTTLRTSRVVRWIFYVHIQVGIINNWNVSGC